MAGGWTLLVLALHLFQQVNALSCMDGFRPKSRQCVDVDECSNDAWYNHECTNGQCKNTYGSYECLCYDGFKQLATGIECEDINECAADLNICGPGAMCVNTQGSYICFCDEGFIPSNGEATFQMDDNATCVDVDECLTENICGPNAACINTIGSYSCVCSSGFSLASGNSKFSGPPEKCLDMCVLNETICGNGTCHSGPQGYYCKCHHGYTNYGKHQSPCTVLNCVIPEQPIQDLDTTHDLILNMYNSCFLTRNSPAHIDGKVSLKKLVSLIDSKIHFRAVNDTMKILAWLDLVQTVVDLIGPPETVIPTSDKKALGLVILSFPTAEAGPALSQVLAVSYPNLEEYTDVNFSGVEAPSGKSFKLNSQVTTVTVSSRNREKLESPVLLRLDHLEQSNDTHTCVFWNSSEEGGRWSQHGCHVVENNSDYTVCSYNHLTSFAVLREIEEDQFELRLITWVGLSLSLVCLFICILTFSLIRSIQSPRTTIHLHLCINLFMATLIFLVGISRTENKVGCAVIAGLLHFFYLAAFCWMCLEGVQLFRMVVLVFNTSFKTLYMMAAGYGVPALIVALSAATNPKGYGTERYCWLSVDYLWSFLRPLYMIVSTNIFFLLITMWKFVQKFSSLNPELDELQKIRIFVIIAVVHLCLHGTMWTFGHFVLLTDNLTLEYLFTITGSLLGVLLFTTHCLLTKQVRDEYKNRLTALCSPRQTKASKVRFIRSRKAHVSKSNQDTEEAQIQEVL